MNFHGLILAAGESKRLGEPKQLLEYQGMTLLKRIMTQIEPLVSEVHVVLGAKETEIKKKVNILNVISNPNWQQGMGSSLACGIANLPHCDAVLVTLCDQIRIPDSHYTDLIAHAQKHPNHIIATEHKTIGVPAVFPIQMFNELSQLTSDEGAKSIIKKHASQLKTIYCDEAATDIDTAQDVKTYLS